MGETKKDPKNWEKPSKKGQRCGGGGEIRPIIATGGESFGMGQRRRKDFS